MPFTVHLGRFEGGEVEKLVITQRNQLRVVVVSVERWSELERALDGRALTTDRGLTPLG